MRKRMRERESERERERERERMRKRKRQRHKDKDRELGAATAAAATKAITTLKTTPCFHGSCNTCPMVPSNRKIFSHQKLCIFSGSSREKWQCLTPFFCRKKLLAILHSEISLTLCLIFFVEASFVATAPTQISRKFSGSSSKFLVNGPAIFWQHFLLHCWCRLRCFCS